MTALRRVTAAPAAHRALAALALALGALGVLAASPAPAHAGGMFLPARGARPLGRAGAFVAGADDLGAIYYNPAGLAGTGHASFLLDAGLVFQGVHYDRIDSGGTRLAGVDDSNGILPLPLLGLSWRPDGLGRRVTFAAALFTPYTGLPTYPDDGPQRYSLQSLNGTAIATAELAASIRITPTLYLGLGFQDVYVSLHNTITLSGCTQLNCAPEDRRFDSATQARVTAPFTPSGNVGLLWLSRFARVGASFQLPAWVHASGTVRTRLPSDPQFTGATVRGDAIDVDVVLPWVLRAGVEVRPYRELRIELGADYEAWSMQRSIDFTPQDVYIDHVIGVGTYKLRQMSLNRSMQDTVNVHVGGEYDLFGRRLTVRLGYLFETSGVPPETLTVLSPDGDKHGVTVGLTVRFGAVRLDAGYGHFFQPDRTVPYGTSRSYQLQPIRPQVAIGVGDGTYQVSNDVLSVGLEARF